MNVRNLTNPITAVDSKSSVQGAKPVRSEVSSEDRDADGRQQHKEENKNPLSEEEMQKAKEYIEKLDGLKSNDLKLTVESGGEYRVFVIHDKDGKIVRRIVEWEMRMILNSADKRTGQLFDKVA
jgi:uncharacterized FlaG/YvyC family protein